MRVTFDNYEDASIDDYYSDFAEIWHRDAGDRSIFDLWFHFVDHASRVARAVRRQRPPEVIDDVADTTVWLMSVIAQCAQSAQDIDQLFIFELLPSDIIWRKYPGTCPACFDSWLIDTLGLSTGDPGREKLRSSTTFLNAELARHAQGDLVPQPCTCLTRATDFRKQEIALSLRQDLDNIRIRHAQDLSSLGKKARKLSDFEQMFTAIYSSVHHVLSLDVIAFRLLEEVGEATRALKDCYTYDNGREPFSDALLSARQELLVDELGDVFAWLFAVALKIKRTYQYQASQYRDSIRAGKAWRIEDDGSFAFANIIWSKYGMTKNGANWDCLKCAGCRCAPCECSRDLKILWSPKRTTDETRRGIPVTTQIERAERDLVFISYSHKDFAWLDRLQSMLKPLVRNKSLSTWDDKKIRAGQKWREEIESALSRAKVAVLIVSPNFLDSDFIAEHELPPLLKAAESAGTKVVWVPVRACLWQETPIQVYQAAHDPETPLAALSEANQDVALVKICQIIKNASQQR